MEYDLYNLVAIYNQIVHFEINSQTCKIRGGNASPASNFSLSRSTEKKSAVAKIRKNQVMTP